MSKHRSREELKRLGFNKTETPHTKTLQIPGVKSIVDIATIDAAKSLTEIEPPKITVYWSLNPNPMQVLRRSRKLTKFEFLAVFAFGEIEDMPDYNCLSISPRIIRPVYVGTKAPSLSTMSSIIGRLFASSCGGDFKVRLKITRA